MIDIHSHLLAGLDDGPADQHESLEMVKALAELGFTHLVATPHRNWNERILTQEEIGAACHRLSADLFDHGLDVKIGFASEHYISDVAPLLSRDALLCYPRRDTFLMEFSLDGFPPRLDELLFHIKIKTKTPVIAHIERYPEVQKYPAIAHDLRQHGCVLLVNLSSVGGGWDRKSERTAKRLLALDLVDALTTDLHSVHGIAAVNKGLNTIQKILSEDTIQKLLSSAPAQIAGLLSEDEGNQ